MAFRNCAWDNILLAGRKMCFRRKECEVDKENINKYVPLSTKSINECTQTPGDESVPKIVDFPQ